MAKPVIYIECPGCGLFLTTLDDDVTHLRSYSEQIPEIHDLIHGGLWTLSGNFAARMLTVGHRRRRSNTLQH